MKRILITTPLTSLSVLPAAFGGIGDTYHCDMVENVAYKKDAIQQYIRDRFTFRWKKEGIVFGKGSYFNEHTASIIRDYSERDSFSGGDDYDRINFVRGRFRYVTLMNTDKEQTDELGVAEARIIIANCSKFDD